MTGFDRANLAQIAAYGPELGETPAATERRMREYMSDASEADIDRAFTEGAIARDVAGRIQTGDIAESASALGAGIASQYTHLRYFVRVRIGPGPNDFRTVADLLPADSTVGEVRAAALGKALEMAAIRHGSLEGYIQGSEDWIAVTPGG